MVVLTSTVVVQGRARADLKYDKAHDYFKSQLEDAQTSHWDFQSCSCFPQDSGGGIMAKPALPDQCYPDIALQFKSELLNAFNNAVADYAKGSVEDPYVVQKAVDNFRAASAEIIHHTQYSCDSPSTLFDFLDNAFRSSLFVYLATDDNPPKGDGNPKGTVGMVMDPQLGNLIQVDPNSGNNTPQNNNPQNPNATPQTSDPLPQVANPTPVSASGQNASDPQTPFRIQSGASGGCSLGGSESGAENLWMLGFFLFLPVVARRLKKGSKA